MRYYFGKHWFVSINLTKGPYSTCLNPHVGLFWEKYHVSKQGAKYWRWIREVHTYFYITFKPHKRFNRNWFN